MAAEIKKRKIIRRFTGSSALYQLVKQVIVYRLSIMDNQN